MSSVSRGYEIGMKKTDFVYLNEVQKRSLKKLLLVFTNASNTTIVCNRHLFVNYVCCASDIGLSGL